MNINKLINSDPKELCNLGWKDFRKINKNYCYTCMESMGFVSIGEYISAHSTKCHCCKRVKLCKPLSCWDHPSNIV